MRHSCDQPSQPQRRAKAAGQESSSAQQRAAWPRRAAPRSRATWRRCGSEAVRLLSRRAPRLAPPGSLRAPRTPHVWREFCRACSGPAGGCCWRARASRPSPCLPCGSQTPCARSRVARAGGGGSSAGGADPTQWVFENEHIIGNGSFGVVYQANVQQSKREVAIKKVLQDKRFKVRRAGRAGSRARGALGRVRPARARARPTPPTRSHPRLSLLSLLAARRTASCRS